MSSSHLLALHVTSANEQYLDQVVQLTKSVREAINLNIEIAYVDQGYASEAATEQAQNSCMELMVVKHTEAKKGFSLLPR